MTEALKFQVQSLPQSPGVYQFYDKNDNLLYIGKAKNLKKRVASYFNKTHDVERTRIMVSRIRKLHPIVVETEMDALLLENNLIKKYQPRYNILLKDDKSYPWICIKKERFPRVFVTRKVIKDGSIYYGPYTSIRTVQVVMELIRDLYQVRTCQFQLTETNIAEGRFKKCLEYHIQKCLAPCEGLQTEEAYNEDIKAIKNLLKGKFQKPLAYFEKKMKSYAAEMLFEDAQLMKEKLDVLKKYQSRSTIVNPSIDNVDVFSIVSDTESAYLNFLKISSGSIIQSYTRAIKKKMAESDKEMLGLFVIDTRQKFQSLSNEIYTPFEIEVGEGITVTVPKQGDKKKLVDLSIRNAKFYRVDALKQMAVIDPEKHQNRILSQMKADLRLRELPVHIECFDNSNIQGNYPVAACVVFKNAKPNKKEYRHFHIKTVKGPDDFASMKEVVFRRYKRLLDEKQSLPQLIVIDGGKGQLSSALESLEQLNLRGKIAIIGIAKRLEEIYFPDDPVPLYLDKTSESLKLIQQLRNEAHRFGITFHRNIRSKGAIQSELHHIKGIGAVTVDKMLKEFKSVKRIKNLSLKQMTDFLGPAKANIMWEHFKKNANQLNE